MAGHTEHVKFLIKLNYIGLFVAFCFYGTLYTSTRQYVQYMRDQVKSLVVQNEMNIAQISKETNRINDVMPSCFKGRK